MDGMVFPHIFFSGAETDLAVRLKVTAFVCVYVHIMPAEPFGKRWRLPH